MANGRLGAADLAATTYTVIYTPPLGRFACLSVNVCSRNAGNVKVRLAVSQASGSAPSVSEFVDYDRVVGNGLPLERTGVVLNYGDKLIAYSDTANVSVVAYGFEEVT